MNFTGEQFILGKTKKRIEEDHLARYEFAKEFVVNKIVLDVACGTGYGGRMIKDFGATKVYGVDLSTEAIDYARHKYGADGLEFINGDATNLSFPDQFFDVIVSYETIEHLDNDARALYLKELRRVLKTDGVLLMSTPNRVITSPFSCKPLNEYHVVEFSAKEFRAVIEAGGFSIFKFYGQRLVNKLWCNTVVRRSIHVLERLFGFSFQLYDIANGPEILEYGCLSEPRYFLTILKKKNV